MGNMSCPHVSGFFQTNKMPRMRRLAATAAMVAIAGILAGCAISQQQEIQVGAEQARQVNAQLPIVTDPAINRYLNTLGDSLARITSRSDIDWHFYMVNTNEFNAFALPGGYIYVNRGVAQRSDNLSQFASVLAHEIGHVVLRHSVKQMQQMERGNVVVTAGCVLLNACGSAIAQTGINVFGSAIFAKFSRDDERQADAAGIEEMVRAGINPNGMPAMFQKLLNERQSQRGSLDAFFATHPLEEERIDNAKARIAAINPAIIRTLTTNSEAFIQFRARVRALPPPPAGAR